MGRNNSGNQISHKANPPFKAYNGDKPYIFISYKHKDAGIVYPMIKKFHDMGFNIWYDEGLPYGENFDIAIPEKIEGATLFVNFITQTCMECANDSNDYMIKESDIAQYLEVPILAIYPEPDEFRLKGYYLTNYLKKQSLYRYDYEDNEDIFIGRCVEVFISKGLEPGEVEETVPKVEETVPEVVEKPITDEPSFQPYEGDEPYIFVSYKHKDWNRILPLVKRLQDDGFNIWCDNGYAVGKQYDIQISDRIANSKLFVTIITEEVIKGAYDVDDYLIKESSVANSLKKNILPIFLDDVQLKGYYMMNYMGRQSIYRHKYDDEDMFIEACADAFKNDFGINPVSSLTLYSRPAPAYCGSEPYIFVSYAHTDSSRVFPEIKRFNELGCNVWYDEGITPGSEWLDEIANALLNCSLLVVFISENAVNSRYVQQEINLALDKNIPVLPIHLEETELPLGIQLRLANVHSILKYQIIEKAYVESILRDFKTYGVI